MAVPKPMQTEFGIHQRLERCELSLGYNLVSAPKLNGSSELSVQPPPVLEAEPGQKKGRIPCCGRLESSSWQSPQSVSLLRLFHFSLKMDKLQSPDGLEKGCDQCDMVLV